MATVWSEIEKDFQKRVQDTVKETQNKAQSCAVRASNQLRNSALRVLRGQRGGKRYKLPHVQRYYTASAPGESPAVRTGKLRQSWGIIAEGQNGSYTAGIYTDVPYADYLEDGTSRMAARPFKEKIKEDARPKVEQIFQQMTK